LSSYRAEVDMEDHEVQTSPQIYARIGGVLYLIIIVIGTLVQIAGLSYLTSSFALILFPSLAHRLYPAILLPALVGEASLCLWLLAKGVNVSKWTARASAATAPRAVSSYSR
jgi:uncharacterized protein DUF4386